MFYLCSNWDLNILWYNMIWDPNTLLNELAVLENIILSLIMNNLKLWWTLKKLKLLSNRINTFLRSFKERNIKFLKVSNIFFSVIVEFYSTQKIQITNYSNTFDLPFSSSAATRWKSINPLTHGRFSDPYFKVLWEGVKLNFEIFFHRGIRNKKFCKVKNVQVWVA